MVDDWGSTASEHASQSLKLLGITATIGAASSADGCGFQFQKQTLIKLLISKKVKMIQMDAQQTRNSRIRKNAWRPKKPNPQANN